MAQGFALTSPQRLFTSAGLPANGWFITTYVAGTTTPLTTYSNATLTSANTNPIVTSADGYYNAFVADGVLIKIAVANELSVLQFTIDNLEPMGQAATLFSSPVITGDSGSGVIFAKQALFTEDATHTIHTATIVVPAGATLLDIYVIPLALWTATGAVTFKCGDANSANGWFVNTNLKATDLILGERLQASNPNNWATLQGTYLTTAGRFGQQSVNMVGGFCATAYSVIGVVTVVTPATAVGRTLMVVLWQVGQPVTPVLT